MVVIENDEQYRITQSQLLRMEEFLARTHRDHPNPEHGLTKVGIRSMIAQLHQQLGRYESRLSFLAATAQHSAAPVDGVAGDLPLTSDKPVR